MSGSLTVRPPILRFALLLLLASALPLPALIEGAGPAVPGTWRNLGPEGGTIYALAVHPSNPNVLYAGGNGGVFRSTDGGASWTVVNRGLSLRPNLSTIVAVVDLAIDPQHPSTLYAALRGDGIARSTDGGDTWTHVDEGLPNFGRALAIDPRNGRRLFAAIFRGIYRTGDGGATWRRLTRGLPSSDQDWAEGVVLDPSAPQTAYAIYSETNGDQRKVFKSTNGGATWRSISTGPLAGRFVSAFAVDPRAPQTLYAGCRSGFFKSVDGGATWRETTSASKIFFFTLAPHPTRAGTLYAGTGAGVYRSVDGGEHWTAVNDGLTGLQVYDLAFSPATPRTLFAGTSLGAGGVIGGVFKSTDAAGSWRFSSHGIHALSANVFAVSPSNPSILWLSTDAGLWKSSDRGDSWTRIRFEAGCLPGGPQAIDFDPVDPDTVYLTTNGSASAYAVCATRNGGATWLPLLRPAGKVFRVRVDPQAPNVLWAAGTGIWKSPDGGRSWIPQSGEPERFEIYDIIPAPSASGTVYAFGSRPRPFLSYELLRTTDGGSSWQNVGTPAGSGLFDSLVVDAFDSRLLYAVERGTLRRSTDGGSSWSIVGHDLFPSAGILGGPRGAPGRLYYALKGDTVYESLDGGATWSPLGNGPDFNFFQFFVTGDPGDPSRLYVGTNGGSLLEFTRTP